MNIEVVLSEDRGRWPEGDAVVISQALSGTGLPNAQEELVSIFADETGAYVTLFDTFGKEKGKVALGWSQLAGMAEAAYGSNQWWKR